MARINIEDDDFEKVAIELLSEKHKVGLAVRERFLWDIWEYGGHLEAWREACESPIEERFFDALAISSLSFGLPIESSPYHLCIFDRDKEILTNALYLEPQKEIACGKKKYRADFLLTCRNRTNNKIHHRVVVECDGHDFHERTKEQATRDKSRDRAMVAEGFTVFRFTGSEIHKDAEKCAKEVCQFLVKAVARG